MKHHYAFINGYWLENLITLENVLWKKSIKQREEKKTSINNGHATNNNNKKRRTFLIIKMWKWIIYGIGKK